MLEAVGCSLADVVLTVLGWSHLAISNAVGNAGAAAGAIAYAALGVLIVRRAGNLTGWFMLVEGAGVAVMVAGSAYAIVGLKASPGALPVPAAVGALAECSFVIVTTGLAAIFLLFPTGRLPPPRLRPARVFMIVSGLRQIAPKTAHDHGQAAAIAVIMFWRAARRAGRCRPGCR